MALKENNSVLAKTCDDEEIFPLVARDITSPKTICYWIMENVETSSEEKLKEALDCALRMRKFHSRRWAY